MPDQDSVKEIRLDPVVPTESVLVSTTRGQRPQSKEALAPRDARAHIGSCPFCRGNEHMTPPQILARPPEKDWHIRIVENLYPVLSDDRVGRNVNYGLRQTIDGYGRHEVIIDHHNHGIRLHEMTNDHLTLLFSTYRERMSALYESDDRLRYVLIFKNYGPAAGASIPHTHSQIIALPVVPENVQAEVQFSQTYYRTEHQCIYCAIIDDAMSFYTTVFTSESGQTKRLLDKGLYVIERTKHFAAIKPFASRYEWEVHIYPLNHEADYLEINPVEMQDFARIVRRTMTRLENVLGGAQYNYFLHTLPHHTEDRSCAESYHWHLEICPRTSIPTGFELGSGLCVNTVSPEDAAQQLREIQLVDHD